MKSPILYTGSKRRLINKGLIELFPSNIDVFVDLFLWRRQYFFEY